MSPMNFQLRSSAFEHEGKIPDLYTCKGQNVSPPLMWENAPQGTKSYALTAEDLDTPVGAITHWVVYNIPPEKSELQEAIPHQDSFPDGTIQGRNAMRQRGYMGPCPPWGRHRYLFRLYALNTVLDYNPKANKKRLLSAMETHILSQAELMGYYSRR